MTDDKGNREDDSEGEALWAFVIRGIEPLKGREKPVLPTKMPPDAVQKKAEKVNIPNSQAVTPPRSPVDDGQKSREVDARTVMRLQRGQIPIEARLDLHGMGQAQAREALQSFLLRCHGQGRRLVLVITGKGREAPGILRQKTPQWLEESPLCDIVLKYHRARPRDGGDGALYILLRRHR